MQSWKRKLIDEHWFIFQVLKFTYKWAHLWLVLWKNVEFISILYRKKLENLRLDNLLRKRRKVSMF